MKTNLGTVLSVGYYQPPPAYQPPPPAPYAPPPQAYYTPPPRRMKPFQPYTAVMVLSLIGMILLIISLMTVWYTWSSTTTEDGRSTTTTMELSFGGGTYSGSDGTKTYSWNEYKNSYGGKSNLPTLYSAVEALLIIALIMAILGFVWVFVHWAGAGSPGVQKALSIFLLVGFILCIVGFLIFTVAQPSAYKADISTTTIIGKGPWESFIGSDSRTTPNYEDGTTTYSSSWYPNIGWGMALVAAIFLIIAFVKARRLPMPVPAYQQPYPAQPAPGPGYIEQPPQQPGYAPPPMPPQQPGYPPLQGPPYQPPY